MKEIHKVERNSATNEELLPGFTQEFPYIASCVEIDRHIGRIVPWHWHRAVELFYMESGGALEYTTPDHVMVFPAGSGGFINSNVLHMTKPYAGERNSRQLLHIFDPSLISGGPGNRIEQKFVLPLTSAAQAEIIPLFPGDPAQEEILALLRQSFLLSDQEEDYELKLRAMLSEIWFRLLRIAKPVPGRSDNLARENDRIKQMMIYIHEHFSEKISVAELAQQAYLSERACYRLFQSYLHMTPAEYIRSCRLQAACRMLVTTNLPITDIAAACGLGSSSYFGKLFREAMGAAPLEYRRRWQNRDSFCQ